MKKKLFALVLAGAMMTGLLAGCGGGSASPAPSASADPAEKVVTIGVIDGDGIGPIITKEATRVLEKLLAELCRRGIRAAVIKHSQHHPENRHDSSRYLTAGAEGSLFVSPTGWLLEMRPEQELPLAEAAELLRQLTGAQLVLAEGYKSEAYPKIAVCRSGVSPTLPCEEKELLAVVCDVPLPTSLPQFSPDDIEKLCDFILT